MIVTFGRYNIITLAHIATIKKMTEINKNVVVGIVNSNKNNIKIPKEIQDFYSECDLKHITGKKFFLPKERKIIMERILSDLSIEGVTVKVINRPEYFIEEFNRIFPKHIYKLSFPELSNGSVFDKRRNEVFEEILQRRIHTVKPDIEMHTSDILENTSELHLKKFLPAYMVEKLKIIGVPK